MSLDRLGLVALLGYLVVLLAVAAVARSARRDASPADHFLASRGLGLVVIFFTLYATAYSGNSLLGYPGEAYRRGFSWIMATGFMMSILVAFHALAPALRPLAVRHRFVTPGDYVRHRFGGERWGRPLVRVVGVLMAIALGNFLLAQLVAMGHLTSEVTGGLVPYAAGVVGLAALILFYETVGGMRAVAWTDTAQGLLMLTGLGGLLLWLLSEAGGLAAVTRAIGTIRPDAVAVPDTRERVNWASTIVLLGLASVVYPQAIQRVYAAESGRTLGRAFALMTFMPLTTTLVVTLIGLAAIPRFESLGRVEADSVMPLLLGEWAASGPLAALLAVLVFVGALAAIMSTADSVLLSLGSVVAVDLLDRPSDRAATTTAGKRIAAVVMLVAVAIAIYPRVTLWRLIEIKMELLVQCVPAFLLALHWRGLRAGPVLAGALAGSLLATGAALVGEKRWLGVHVGVVAVLLNAGIAVLGSLLPERRAGRASATRRPAGV